MTPAEKRSYARTARMLKPALHIGKSGLTDAVLQQARTLLHQHTLVKVRLPAEDRAAVRSLAAELAARIPCDLVGLTGCVAVLYLAADAV